MGIQLRTSDAVDPTLLDQEDERAILKLLCLYPEVLEGAALNGEPYRLVYFLQDLAARFHAYYKKHRFLEPEPEIAAVRLCLAGGVGRVIGNALGLLGVEAPRTM